MKDPYGVLGLTAESTQEELKARYEELKAQYGEQRFKSGAEGNEGARKLSELESAWDMISADFEKKQAKEEFGDADYGAIDNLIKNGSYDDAQHKLDEITDRTAEWHYLQSIVYYKREWLSDSRKQLAIAVSMEPRNEKYKTALEKMDMVMGNPQADPRIIGMDPAQQPPAQQEGQMCGGNALSNCCMAYICTDCCCSMTRCCG